MGATGLKCIFFLQICNEVLGEKKEGACRSPPTGDRTMSPTPGATGPCRLLGGDRVPISLCHLSLKIQEKREG